MSVLGVSGSGKQENGKRSEDFSKQANEEKKLVTGAMPLNLSPKKKEVKKIG